MEGSWAEKALPDSREGEWSSWQRKGSPANFWVGEIMHITFPCSGTLQQKGLDTGLPLGTSCWWSCNSRAHQSNLRSWTWQAGKNNCVPSLPPRFFFYILETKCVQNVFPYDFDFLFPNDYFNFEIPLSFCKVAFKKWLKNPKSKWLVSFQVEGINILCRTERFLLLFREFAIYKCFCYQLRPRAPSPGVRWLYWKLSLVAFDTLALVPWK